MSSVPEEGAEGDCNDDRRRINTLITTGGCECLP